MILNSGFHLNLFPSLRIQEQGEVLLWNPLTLARPELPQHELKISLQIGHLLGVEDPLNIRSAETFTVLRNQAEQLMFPLSDLLDESGVFLSLFEGHQNDVPDETEFTGTDEGSDFCVHSSLSEIELLQEISLVFLHRRQEVGELQEAQSSL